MPLVCPGCLRACARSFASVLLAAALSASPPAVAQPDWLDESYLLDRWTNVDGLPVNGTTDVHIGNRGYLWLATFDGLVRFDGYRFRTFNASNDQLPGNRLTRLVQQDSGLIWVLTEQYDLASFDGRRFHAAGTAQGLPAERALKLHHDGRDRLWAGTERGLARACGPSCFKSIGHRSLDGRAVQAFADAADGGIWAGTGAGVVVGLSGDDVREVVDAAAGLALADVRALLVDDDGVLWAGGVGGLATIVDGRAEMLRDFRGETINDLELAPGGDVIAQAYDRSYRLSDGRWRVDNAGPIGGYVRLVAAGPQGSEWRVRQNELLRDGDPVVRASCPIRDFEFDAVGGVWLATLCDGLWRLRQRQFETIAEHRGLPEGPVYGLVEDDAGRVWASVGAGLVAEIRDGQVTTLHEAGSSGQMVGTVATDGDGAVWVGKGGLCRMGAAGCTTPSRLPRVLRKSLVRSIFEDARGGLWVGSQAGLWRRFEGRWQSMQPALALPDWVQVQVIIQAGSGNLWFGTDSSGLRRRSTSGDVVALGSAEGLSSNRVRDLHEDAAGRLWVVTADSGLCRSDRPETESGLVFTCMGESEGLYSNSLHRLLADGQGRFWFNSNTGVFRVDQRALERVLDGRSSRVYPRVYTERDGLPDREGNGGVQNAGIRLNDGRLAFPGQGGIVVFDPDDVRDLEGVPRVVLEQVRLPDGTDLPAGGTVQIPLGERVFSLRFTGVKPGLTGQTYFRYRMNGGPWVELGADRNLTFDDVRPGRHELEIAAVDAESGLSGPVAGMKIDVPALVYERRDVRFALALALVALIALWLMRRRRAAIRLQQYLNREVERRTVEAMRQQRRAESALSADVSATNGGEAQRPADSSPGEASLLADEVRAWVENNVQHGSLSVEKLAESLFMSRSKLHRRLVEQTGRSPGEFIRDVRLGIARQMLHEQGASVSNVAYAVGFSSVSGFSRAYRSHFGESPSQTAG